VRALRVVDQLRQDLLHLRAAHDAVDLALLEQELGALEAGRELLLERVAITRGPAKPIKAPGSASVMSHTLAKEAVTPPVVGCVITQIEKPLASFKSASAAQVFAICISEITPSCMRAPPEPVKITSGRPSFCASSAASAIFSPTTSPIEPPGS
jgi:hypothetical protein